MELVFIENNRPVTDSLTVADVFSKNHADVLRDIRALGCSKEFSLRNFAESTYVNERGREYLRIVMTEQGFTLLVMGYTGQRAMDFKEQYINEFDRMRGELQRRQLVGQFKLPTTYPEALRALAEAEEEREGLRLAIQQKVHQLEEQAPKVLFADAVTTSHTSVLVRELAVILKQNGIDIGQNRLFEWLRENGYLIRRHGTDYNTPTQKSMELGVFEVKETPVLHSNGSQIHLTAKVTGKGQVYFVNKLLEQAKQPVGV